MKFSEFVKRAKNTNPTARYFGVDYSEAVFEDGPDSWYTWSIHADPKICVLKRTPEEALKELKRLTSAAEFPVTDLAGCEAIGDPNERRTQ